MAERNGSGYVTDVMIQKGPGDVNRARLKCPFDRLTTSEGVVKMTTVIRT